MRIYCFGISINRNIRNLMRIHCFGINLIFASVIIFAGMVSVPFWGLSSVVFSVRPGPFHVKLDVFLRH